MDEKVYRLRMVNALLWGMTFQLVFAPSRQQNLPGYVGCFSDSGDRAFPVRKESSYSQSVERCFRSCLEPLQYKYLGLEYYYECYCGNNENYGKYGQEKDSDCQYACAGNEKQICGDSWLLSVYRVSDGVCSNDIGPPTKGGHIITNPSSLPYNLNNFKFFGTRVDFSCDPGYTLHGASSIECIETGYNNVTWSDSVPTCEVPTTTTLPTTFGPTTTVPTTTTHVQSTVTDWPMTSGNETSERASSATLSNNLWNNEPNTGALQTGAIVGIAIGAGILIALMLVVIVLCKRRRKNKKRPDVAVATNGKSYTNNAYALPEIVSQSITDQSQAPVYSQVIKRKPDSDDVYAVPDDVTNPGELGNGSSNQPQGVTASHDQGSGWVENTLYDSKSSFPGEPTATYYNLAQQKDRGDSPTMQANSGWVENIIYE